MYRFNNDNIICGQIKQLLSTYNLPKFKVLKQDMYVCDGDIYLFKNNIYIYKAKNDAKIVKFSGELDDKFQLLYNNYLDNMSIVNLTKRLEMKSSIYDSYTHKYLGDYLRWIRDYKNINLMSMYNCFSNESVTNIDKQLKDMNVKSFIKESCENYNVFMIPVKFYEKYTVSVECERGVELFCALYDNDKLLSYPNLINSTYIRHGRTSYRKPILYDLHKYLVIEDKYNDKETNIVSADMYKRESHLKLFIKIPKTCNSTITVLEGDYTQHCNYSYQEDGVKILNNYIVSGNYKLGSEQYIYTEHKDEKYKTKLQLLQLNTGVSYPFSDRLIEFLFSNVVTPMDDISKNIENLQRTLLSRKDSDIRLSQINHFGIWQEEIRECLYKIAERKNLLNKSYDITGYLDKDLEDAIGGIIHEWQ